jgi:hypothetical protein
MAMHATHASFDLPFHQLVSSPAAAIGGARAAGQLDVIVTRDLVEAGRRARRGGLVVAVMMATAAVPMLFALSGALPEYLRAIQAIGLACWLLSSAQGIALFAFRRRAFLAVCAQHAIGPRIRLEVEGWLEATEGLTTRSHEEQAQALLLFLRGEAAH